MEEASPRLRLETLQHCCHTWSWESPQPRNHHAKWTWSPSLLLPRICWSLTRASYWQMPTGRKHGKCSLQTPSPKKGGCESGRQKRNKCTPTLWRLGQLQQWVLELVLDPQVSALHLSDRGGIRKATPTTSLKRLKIKDSPQKPTFKTERWRFTVLKSIREDKKPTQERKQLSLIQK